VNEIVCTDYGHPRPGNSLNYVCSECGAYFSYNGQFEIDYQSVDLGQTSIWRYRHVFGLDENVTPISLGEGITPLVSDWVDGREISFKLEYLNPTGSYKDRGTTVLISYLHSLGVESAIEDSSGNAGASFAAYAARAGIRGKVYVPAYASGPKRAQIEAYGVELVEVPGPRSNAARAVVEEAESGVVYASHIYQPMVFPGYATLAFELYEQLGIAPGAVITPVGQGSLLLGMDFGFRALLAVGLIQHLPQLIGVQALACAPLWASSAQGKDASKEVIEGDTIAEGIRILHPLRGDEVTRAVKSSGGFFLAVAEGEILPARDHLASRGFYVEPTSAVVWPALLRSMEKLNDPIVIILTGSGLKYSPA
jgi:threonine synthase